jgi:hypothetical protein
MRRPPCGRRRCGRSATCSPRRGFALAPLLRSAPEPTLRAVAAETLARHAPDEGCAEVMDQVGLEAPGDRVRFERAATLCAGR